MPGGRCGLYPGIEKKHQLAEYKQYEAENGLLRAVGRDHLLELAQAEKDGRLVVLPCKAGDTLYRVIRTKDGYGPIVSATVSGLHIGDTVRNRRYEKGREYIVLKVDGNFCAHIDMKKIGKTVFLTREEAEEALKKREAERVDAD